MSKTEILHELSKLTRTERREIRLRSMDLDTDDWLEHEGPLTAHEKASSRRGAPAYAKAPDAVARMLSIGPITPVWILLRHHDIPVCPN